MKYYFIFVNNLKQHVMSLTKYNEEQVADFKKFLTIKEVKIIAKKHGYGWSALYHILTGKANTMSYKTVKDPEARTAMIKECENIVATRKANHIEVITDKTVK